MSEETEKNVSQYLNKFIYNILTELALSGASAVQSGCDCIDLEAEFFLEPDGKTILNSNQNDSGIKVRLSLKIDSIQLHDIFYKK